MRQEAMLQACTGAAGCWQRRLCGLLMGRLWCAHGRYMGVDGAGNGGYAVS
jgi:hypothetical protein